MRVGFIGLGRMGRPMLESLAQAGNEVLFCDLRAQLAAELAAEHRGAAANAGGDCRRADAAVVGLPGPAENAAVVTSLLAAARPGFLVIHHHCHARA